MTMLYYSHCAKSRSDCSEYTSRNAVAGGISEKTDRRPNICMYILVQDMNMAVASTANLAIDSEKKEPWQTLEGNF